ASPTAAALARSRRTSPSTPETTWSCTSRPIGWPAWGKLVVREVSMNVARLLVLVPLALVTASARADAPKAYTSAALGFSASFPSEVKEGVAPEGGGTAAGVDPKGIMYMVGLTPANEEVGKRKSVKEQLDDGIAGAVEKVHGKVASQKDVKLDKNPGR